MSTSHRAIQTLLCFLIFDKVEFLNCEEVTSVLLEQLKEQHLAQAVMLAEVHRERIHEEKALPTDMPKDNLSVLSWSLGLKRGRNILTE